MKILWTNHALDQPAGTETFTRTMTRELKSRGHHVEVFSSQPGRIARELADEGIPVHAGPIEIGKNFDLIHGQHYPETFLALSVLPNIPALYFCHADPNLEWMETPLRHPRILRIATTCSNMAEHLRGYLQEPDADIAVIPNAIDLQQFITIRPTPTKPQKALVFHNTMREQSPEWAAIREACSRRNISLDTCGAGFGTRNPHPENVLPEYDLVFAGGRSAMESIASGCPTMIIGPQRIGGIASIEDIESLFASNFTRTKMEAGFDAGSIIKAIESFSPTSFQPLPAAVRKRCSPAQVATLLEDTYNKLLAEKLPDIPAGSEARIAANGLLHALKNHEQHGQDSHSRDRELVKAKEKAALLARDLKTAKEKIDTAKKVLQRGWFRGHAWQAVQKHWDRIGMDEE